MKNYLLISTTLIACIFCFPAQSLAQIPNLGSASDFILFTSIGALGNTGNSHLTGNIGTNNGAITGFGNVDGNIHNANMVSSQCAADLLSAYNELNAAIPSSSISILLGNSQTLTPGVYSISGNTVLNQNLILNAQGNENAIFIFKIQGTFSTNSLSEVQLINATQAANVYWKIEGMTALASGTDMKGTIIVNNAAINIASGVILEGRAMSTTGAVNVNGITAFIPTRNGSPLVTGPVAPVLNSVACYGLFTSNGALTNTGMSTVAGDVGTNLGLTTGFIPAHVAGTIHTSPDASTALCASDLTTVSAYLSAMSADIELMSPAQFGNGLTLTPHTYLLNAATILNDTLYLNALGNSNAVFILKINGALSTTSYAEVILLNGAQPYNIYWIVDGAVSLNDHANFKGTIINNGAIQLSNGVQLEGRALTTSGAFSTFAIHTTKLLCITNLQVSLFLQGYYNNGTNTMEPVLLNQGVGTGNFVTDSIHVTLRNPVFPFGIIYSATVLLQTDGEVTLTFPTPSTNYYIAVTHRNSIETWSKYPVAPGIELYDFSTSADQAYGNNMMEVSPGIWAFYSGELNADSNIDLLDMAILEADINNFEYGYIASDINGDGNVDLLDNSIPEENMNNFIYSIHP